MPQDMKIHHIRFGQVKPDDLATNGLTKEVAARMMKRQMNGGNEVGGFVPPCTQN